MTHGIQEQSNPVAWPKALELARSRAKRLVEAVKVFPAPLPELAKFQSVEQVVFRKLAVDGCIKATESGFIIYANKLEFEPELLAQWYEGESLGQIRLPARIRFTLAHELAHTLFYSHRSDRPQSLIGYRKAEQRSRLEAACNSFASQLLLPAKEVARFATTSKFWVPSVFRAFAKQVGVSDPVLVFRLKPHLGKVGIALVEFGGDGRDIKVSHACIGEGIFARSSQIDQASFTANLLMKFREKLAAGESSSRTFNATCESSSFLIGSRPALWNCWLERCYASRWIFSFRLEG